MTTRFGILGTGIIVRKFAEASRLIPGLEVVAIASRDGERARATAATLNIPRAHTGYEALLNDPEVDIVINALHNGLHAEWSIRAFEAGKHVLCEKPLACNAAEAARMFAAARQHKRWLMEGFMYRFHPQFPLLVERIRRGDIGRVLRVHSHRISHGRDATNPRYSRETGGGALLDIGCYSVNFSRALIGAEPQRVTANAHYDPQSGIDLTLTATLEFPDNATAQFCCSFEAEPSWGAEIVGSEGRVVFPHPWLPPVWPAELTFVRNGKSETITVPAPEAPPHVLAPFALELQHLATCVHENRAPLYPSGLDMERDALANARTLDAIAAAASTRQPVAL